jgi:hypothetical protein
MTDILVRLSAAERAALSELAAYGLAALKDLGFEPRAVDLEAVRKLREAEEER